MPVREEKNWRKRDFFDERLIPPPKLKPLTKLDKYEALIRHQGRPIFIAITKTTKDDEINKDVTNFYRYDK